MNKLAFAALGLLTRAGKSLIAFARHDMAAPASRKKSKVAHKTGRGSAGAAKLR
jgi:hypothetical protein